jgi:poly(3-hydroxybutyrate) depolymerase
MILMGGPIDTRVNPTGVNDLAKRRGIDWFRTHVITKVPFPNPGFMRDVYPGFLQLNGFVSMNLDRHIEAHKQLFLNLVKGDGDSAHKHKEFYDEYLAVMDLSAEFYLQTVDTVFVKHALPKGQMTHRGRPVDPSQIKRTALLTVEGEFDDISGVGQTEAAHRLCVNIPEHRHAHWLQQGVGHYGVFNGSRFRSEIAPRISDFILSMRESQPKWSGRTGKRRAGNGAAVHSA